MKVLGSFRKAGCLTVQSDMVWDDTRFEEGPDIVENPTNDLGIAGFFDEDTEVHYVFPVPDEYKNRIYAWHLKTGEVFCYGLECDTDPERPFRRNTRVFYVGAISVSKKAKEEL